MPSKARILIDECLGRPLVEQLKSMIGFDQTEVDVAHVLDLGFGGVNDDEWIPKIAGEGWIVITADRGKQPKKGKGEKLHVVCAQSGVTHAAFSRSYAKAKAFERTTILLSLWPKLVALKDAPPGSAYTIRPSSSGNATLVVKGELDDAGKEKVQQTLPLADLTKPPDNSPPVSS